jgi:hypothetical protein
VKRPSSLQRAVSVTSPAPGGALGGQDHQRRQSVFLASAIDVLPCAWAAADALPSKPRAGLDDVARR